MENKHDIPLILRYDLEFMAITKHVLKQKQAIKKGTSVMIQKDFVINLMDRNAYETSYNKLKAWKDLSWIITDENRFTARHRNKATGEQEVFLKINLKAYKRLAAIGTK